MPDTQKPSPPNHQLVQPRNPSKHSNAEIHPPPCRQRFTTTPTATSRPPSKKRHPARTPAPSAPWTGSCPLRPADARTTTFRHSPRRDPSSSYVPPRNKTTHTQRTPFPHLAMTDDTTLVPPGCPGPVLVPPTLPVRRLLRELCRICSRSRRHLFALLDWPRSSRSCADPLARLVICRAAVGLVCWQLLCREVVVYPCPVCCQCRGAGRCRREAGQHLEG